MPELSTRPHLASLLSARAQPVLVTALVAVALAATPSGAGGAAVNALSYVVPVGLAVWCGAFATMRWGLAATLALDVAIQIHIGFSEAPNLEIAIATLPPWWCGTEARRRHQLVKQLADETRTLEAEEEAFVHLSVERERARIARDLHDIVSHQLALIVVQAGAGRLAEPWDADVAAERLATIRAASTEALSETDRLVALMHPGGRALPRLRPLLERARELCGNVTVARSVGDLPLELEAVAHYVLREALTNAIKHAPGAAPDVLLSIEGRTLTIGVRNAVRGPRSALADTGSGSGLIGLRERLEALGGKLTAGEDGAGGFELTAILPVP